MQSVNCNCKKVTNNKYNDCPPRMDDGRHFTDYRPSCHINNLVQQNNTILNSYDYRMFLTQKATHLIDLNRTYACELNCCGPCKEPYHQGTMLPEQAVRECNKNTCNTVITNQNGLGQGRKYDDQSGVCSYVSGNRHYNSCPHKNTLFNYYNHIDSKTQGETVPRVAIPGGGEPQPFNL